MKPVLRYQSQLLFRTSYKPGRVIRIRPTGKLNLVFRFVCRFGVKPQLTIPRSSKAKPPVNNRKTAEHYRAGRSFFSVG
jgi:hypothetical protein